MSASSEQERAQDGTTFKLVREGTDTPIAQACAKCGRVYQLNDAFAERCCNRRCERCRAPLPERYSWINCEPCRAVVNAERQAKRVAAAQVIPARVTQIAEAEWDGPVYVDGYGSRDGYFDDTDDLREWCDEEGVAVPAWAYPCESRPLRLDAESIIDSALEQGEHHDDASGEISPAKHRELQQYLDTWAKGTGVASLFADERRVVVLPSLAPSPERSV